MTNREKLASMAMYDMLLMINENLDKVDGRWACALDALGAETERRCANVTSCRYCIARWLNEEHDE